MKLLLIYILYLNYQNSFIIHYVCVVEFKYKFKNKIRTYYLNSKNLHLTYSFPCDFLPSSETSQEEFFTSLWLTHNLLFFLLFLIRAAFRWGCYFRRSFCSAKLSLWVMLIGFWKSHFSFLCQGIRFYFRTRGVLFQNKLPVSKVLPRLLYWL